MPKIYRHRVTVAFRTFPVDMLRYDRLCPEHETDSHVIEASVRHEDNPGRCNLLAYGDSKTPRLTPDRWRSFGASIVAVELIV